MHPSRERLLYIILQEITAFSTKPKGMKPIHVEAYRDNGTMQGKFKALTRLLQLRGIKSARIDLGNTGESNFNIPYEPTRIMVLDTELNMAHKVLRAVIQACKKDGELRNKFFKTLDEDSCYLTEE